MHKVHLTYTLGPDSASRELHHPLLTLLDAVHGSGSISGAARALGMSYRHVWGELKRWEAQFGQPLVHWTKGQPALLAPFGEKLLWAERRALARLAPQIEALRSELELAFAIAFDDGAGLITAHASHDEALPRLRALCQDEHRLLLDIRFSGSVEALEALADGRCLLAGFHARTDAPRRSATAATYRPLLKPGRHKLIGFVRRTQGLMLPSGNPRRVAGLADLADPARALRFVNRARGTGTRLLLEDLLHDAGVAAAAIDGFERSEPSHRAVAAAVASGGADVGFGIEAVAREAGLDFVPLAEERYFLVTLAAHLEDPQVRTLRAVLQSPAWKAQLAGLAGHTDDHGGEVLSLRRVLPWWTYRKTKP